MAFNKPYNTRYSDRFNSPGQFMQSGEPFSPAPRKPMSTNAPPPSAPIVMPKEEEVVVMDKDEMSPSLKSEDSSRPYWMKSRMPGVRKLSNRERRRRQNENLRRLLTPKNALMVLNEMMPNEQVTNQFKVEPSQYKTPNTHSFCADLTIDGNVYQGYGDNKLMARNAAAEQAIRDLIIKRMNKVLHGDTGSANGTMEVAASGAGTEGAEGAEGAEAEETLPMIQLASFALHKLFSEWEYEGHSVPQLKPNTHSTSESASEMLAVPPPPRKVKELPANASSLHPCMLLTHMRPNLEYRELPAGAEGERSLRPVFTMAVDVDGVTYIGKGSNKKEGRKMAAKAACDAIFNITFDEDNVQQNN